MRVVHLLVLVLVVSAVAMDADTAEEGKPRKRRHENRYQARSVDSRGRPLVKPTIVGTRHRFPGSKPLVIVPRCDPRAYPDTAAHARACGSNLPPLPTGPIERPKFSPVLPRARVLPPARVLPAIAPPSPRVVPNPPAPQPAAPKPPTPVLKSKRPVLRSTAAASSSSCLSKFSGSNLAQVAIRYQTTYKNNKVIYNQSLRQFGLTVKYSDCSSFTWSAMNGAGYSCLFDNARNTAAMQPLMRARGGFKQTAATGDLAMWGDHVGIVVQACAGGKIDMVAMGVHGCARTGCITLASLKGWGSGGWIGFWTPRA